MDAKSYQKPLSATKKIRKFDCLIFKKKPNLLINTSKK